MANTQQTELNKQRVRSAWIFLAPMLVVLLMVAVWPLARTIWLSLTDAKIDMMTGPDVKFVGLDNYIGEYGLFFTGSEIISSAWWGAIKNTFFFSIVSIFFTIFKSLNYFFFIFLQIFKFRPIFIVILVLIRLQKFSYIQKAFFQ